ncbi:MAG: Hsp33 family molecular chaperone HslO [Candidatus Cloacimonadota bacterium]|nr:Hsp33 family molecular chaperone HslO [Candidatus Cloacimonadota bacterium]
MPDKIIRGHSISKNIRFFGIDSTEVVSSATQMHNLSITNSVLLGRVLSATLMMGTTLKNRTDSITLKFAGDGPSEKCIAVSKNDGKVKGYVANPEVELPKNELHQIDVKGAIGKGMLTVIKDMGLKQPYISQIELISGEIAQDLTYYFAKSEQTPSAVGLGVLVDIDGSVRQAGGFIVQLMPNTPEEEIKILEKNLDEFPNLTDVLDMGKDIETIVRDFILKGIEVKVTQTKKTAFSCDCSKDRFRNGLRLLGKSELNELVKIGDAVPTVCHFCNTEYVFELDEIEEIFKTL